MISIHPQPETAQITDTSYQTGCVLISGGLLLFKFYSTWHNASYYCLPVASQRPTLNQTIETPALYEPAKAERRKNGFDFLRLLFAFLVILAHAPVQLAGKAGRAHEWFVRFTHGQYTLGDMAVDGFFLISGYFITQSWHSSASWKDYLLKRVGRIYPGFLVAALFSTWLLGYWANTQRVGYVSSHHIAWFIIYAAVLQIYSPVVLQGVAVPSVNGSSYTIQYEFVCYVLVMLLACCRKLSKWVVLSLIAVLILLALPGMPLHPPVALLPYPHIFPLFLLSTPGRYPRFFLYFLTGCLFWLFRDRIRYTGMIFAVSVAGFVAAILVSSLAFLLAPCFAYIIFFTAFRCPSPLHHIARYGDFSYGLYLYAWPVAMALLWVSHNQIGVTPLILFTFIGGMFCAIFSWHLIEKPCLRYVHKVSNKQI